MSRATVFDEKIFADILKRLTRGETLLNIIDDDERYPCRRTLQNWVDKNSKLDTRYRKARNAGYSKMREKAWETLLESSTDYNGKMPTSAEFQRAEVMMKMVDAMQLSYEKTRKLKVKGTPAQQIKRLLQHANDRDISAQDASILAGIAHKSLELDLITELKKAQEKL